MVYDTYSSRIFNPAEPPVGIAKAPSLVVDSKIIAKFGEPMERHPTLILFMHVRTAMFALRPCSQRELNE